MESFGLYCNAAFLGRKALGIMTCSDSLITGKAMTTHDRQTALGNMVTIALECL